MLILLEILTSSGDVGSKYWSRMRRKVLNCSSEPLGTWFGGKQRDGPNNVSRIYPPKQKNTRSSPCSNDKLDSWYSCSVRTLSRSLQDTDHIVLNTIEKKIPGLLAEVLLRKFCEALCLGSPGPRECQQGTDTGRGVDDIFDWMHGVSTPAPVVLTMGTD